MYIRVYIDLCVYIFICACICLFVRVYICLCVYIFVCACIYLFVRVCACIHTYTHAHMRAYAGKLALVPDESYEVFTMALFPPRAAYSCRSVFPFSPLFFNLYTTNSLSLSVAHGFSHVSSSSHVSSLHMYPCILLLITDTCMDEWLMRRVSSSSYHTHTVSHSGFLTHLFSQFGMSKHYNIASKVQISNTLAAH